MKHNCFNSKSIEMPLLSNITVSCTVGFVQLTVQCFIQIVCCGFHFALEFGKFNLILQFVIKLIAVYTCCEYGISDLFYSGNLFGVSFVCNRCKQTIRLLTVSYGPFQATSTQHNKYQLQFLFRDKTYGSNSLYRLSQQDSN